MLTQVQQNSIRINIAGRGINTIDLEAEMVDHISSAVEEKMENGMSFRDAYKATIISFGSRGLEYMQNDKNKSLIKRGLKLILHKFIEITTPPKVIFSFIFGLLVFLIISFTPYRENVFLYLSTGTWFSALIVYGIYRFKNNKNKFSQINAFDSIFASSYYIIHLIIITPNSSEKMALESDIYLSLLITIPALIFASFFLVLVSTKNELNQKYNEYIIATGR